MPPRAFIGTAVFEPRTNPKATRSLDRSIVAGRESIACDTSPPARDYKCRQFSLIAGLCPSVNSKFCFSLPLCFVFQSPTAASASSRDGTDDRSTEQDLRNVNDPSAGSPTETLLRLLLPLNDQVWSSSRQHRQCRDIAAHQSEDLTKSFNR